MGRFFGFVKGAVDLGKSLFTKAVPGADDAAGPGLLSKVWGGVKKFGGVALVATGVDGLFNGGRIAKSIGSSLGMGVKDTVETVTDNTADVSASSGTRQMFSSFYNVINELGMLLKFLGVGGGIPEAMMNLGGKGVHRTTSVEDPKPTDNLLGATWGDAASVAAIGGGGLLAYKTLKGGPGGPNAGGSGGATPLANSAQMNLFDEAPGVAKGGGLWSRITSGAKSVLSVVPGGKKLLALGAVGGVVGLSMMPGDAEAATVPTTGATASPATTAAASEIGTVHAAAAEVSGLGLSIVGARTAAQGVAPVAAGLTAKLGARAIPGIASIFAAGETIYNTTSHALKGEWSKAGLSLVSGVGETVAGLGGALGYATIGTAWREAVRGVGAMAFGKENTIDHSYIVQGAGLLKDTFGNAHDDRRAAPAAATPGFTPAGLAFGS